MIGDRLKSRLGSDADVKYVYNIMDLGYRGEDILWLVENGVLTLWYQSSSYLTDGVPELGMIDLPFIFDSKEHARALLDGKLGQVLAANIGEHMNYRIPGYYENGFRQISNRLQPIYVPADMAGMRIRVLPREIQNRTFELLGAVPLKMGLTEAIRGSGRRNPGRAGESVREHGDLRSSQISWLSYRHQPFLSISAYFPASSIV
jgi:TRAP-type transport system periplasmic protein